MTELSERVERGAQEQSGQVEKLAAGSALTIFEQLRKMEGQFAAALPQHIAPEHFLRVALTELRLKPDLQTCSSASLMGALMLSAQLGLVPGPLGHVYLVPYGNKQTRAREVQFQIGYKGYIALADRAGYAITGHGIREGDYIEYQLGTGAYLTHKPKIRGGGETYAWWCKAERAATGFVHIEVLNRDEVETYRKRSPAKGSGPWTTDYDAMALKTVVRRIMRLLPLDSEQSASADWSADGSRALYQPGTHELTVNRADDFDGLETEPEAEEPEA